ncbi:hypothetical protein BN1723_020090, partial [Verticillium longisporum]
LQWLEEVSRRLERFLEHYDTAARRDVLCRLGEDKRSAGYGHGHEGAGNTLA